MWEASWERNSAVIKSEWKEKPPKNKEQITAHDRLRL